MRTFALACGALCGLGGCATHGSVAEAWHSDELLLTSGAPQRLAILPFADRVPSRGLLHALALPLIGLARLVTLDFSPGVPTSADTAQALRQLLSASLQDGALAVVNVPGVDARLAQRGVELSTADARSIGEALDVDLVLRGTLEQMGATWYAIEASRQLVASVSIESARDGRELFRARVTVDDAAGLRRGPTGYVSLVAVPLAAIDGGPWTRMAIEWADEVGRQLLVRDAAAPGSSPPALEQVHLAPENGALHAGDLLQVTAHGTPGGTAAFAIGTLRMHVPMREVAAGEHGLAVYRGSYEVQTVDRVGTLPIFVELIDRGGRRTVALAAQRAVLGEGGQP